MPVCKVQYFNRNRQNLLKIFMNRHLLTGGPRDKDYYAILGVHPSAEEAVISAAYRALAKLYHPDLYKGSDAAERMAKINEAAIGLL